MADETDKTTELGGGEQPSAAALGNKIFVIFAKRENGERGVWLLIVNRREI